MTTNIDMEEVARQAAGIPPAAPPAPTFSGNEWRTLASLCVSASAELSGYTMSGWCPSQDHFRRDLKDMAERCEQAAKADTPVDISTRNADEQLALRQALRDRAEVVRTLIDYTKRTGDMRTQQTREVVANYEAQAAALQAMLARMA